MESPSSLLQQLPRASFVCENCSRHVVVVLDSGAHLLNTTPQTDGQPKREVSVAPGGGHPAQLQFHCIEGGTPYPNDAGSAPPPTDDAAASALHQPLQQELQRQLQLPASSVNGSSSSVSASCALSPFAEPADPSGQPVSVEESAAADSGMMYPLCAACLDADIAELEPSTAHEKRLIRKYEKALRRLQRRSARAPPPSEDADAEAATETAASTLAELRQLEEEERKLEAEISEIEAYTAQKELQKRAIVSELAELHMWHVEFWLLYTNHWLRMMRHGERKRAMERLFAYIGSELRRLKRLNVVTDAFHIWTYKFLPSINKCRIDVFYRKCQAHPSNYRLVPRGQFSYLIRKKDGAALPLHGGGGEVGLSRFFYSNKRFDSAMMAYLECVKELFDLLVTAAEDRSKERAMCRLLPFPELPYEIDGDRVGGFSIRLQLNQDERWTKALKLLLIDMKWLLEYIERICLVTGAAP